MKNNFIDKFGTNDEDIKNIYLEINENNKIDSLYIYYNSGRVEIINKPKEMEYPVFSQIVSQFLSSVGATPKDKGSKWFAASRDSKRIDFNLLDQIYMKQQNSINEIEEEQEERYKIKNIKKIEALEELKDEESMYKAKCIRNIVISASLALLVCYSMCTDGYLKSRSNLIMTLDILAMVCAMFDILILSLNNKLKQKLEKELTLEKEK